MLKVNKYEKTGTNDKKDFEETSPVINNSLSVSVRTFTEEEMFNSSKGFCFGNSYSNPKKTLKMFWDLEAKKTLNYSLLIAGGSGSGKTRLAKNIIKDLDNRGKNQIIVDVQGDMQVEGEETFKFTRRRNNMGFNYFTFSKDEENGGPVSNSMLIIELFKNSVMNKEPGPIQKAVLKQSIIDCYRSKLILDEDESTWDNELPTPKYFEKFILKILGTSGNTSSLLAKAASQIVKIKHEIKKDGEDERREKKLNEAIEEYNKLHSMFKDYIASDEHETLFEGIKLNEEYVDISYYYNPTNFKTLQTLYTYIKTMSDCPLFGEKPFPEIKGLMRFDISGFTSYGKPEEAIFFINYVFSMFFRGIKERGEYRLKDAAYRQVHGKYADSFCWVDESKLILPSGNNKENPYHIINRIVTEARKYGGGMGIMSQRISHFSGELINSIYTKVLLKTEDAKDNIKRLNMNTRANTTPEALFSHQRITADGVAIVGTTGGLYDSIATPWFKELDKEITNE